MRRVVGVGHGHDRAVALTTQRQCAVHLRYRPRQQVRHLGIDRILGEVDELLSVLSCKQTGQVSLGQAVFEQDLAEPPSALRRFGKRLVDGLERQQT